MHDLVFHKADFICVLAGYLLGSVPVGYWLGKLKGIDLTKEGSGSTGATNVLRRIGKVEALVTFLFDIGKGFFSAYLVMKFNRTWNINCHLLAGCSNNIFNMVIGSLFYEIFICGFYSFNTFITFMVIFISQASTLYFLYCYFFFL